ncbi:acyltransferase family protein, partial [Sphingomonas faeni]
MTKNMSVYLSLLRFAAAIAVVLGHARAFVVPNLQNFLTIHGGEAVAVFFVLSGFVIRFVTAERGEKDCDVTPAFHPAATRDRPLLSRRSAGEA